MDKFVSVIIPVLNNIEELRKTLTALEAQTYPQKLYEVIVVDNGSKQDLSPVVSQFKQAKLTYEPQPGSYIARNQGISIAGGEILAFTDSDCIPEPEWLVQGVAQLRSVKNCGLVAGKINFSYQDPQQPTIVELYDSSTFLNQKRYIEQHHYGATANLFTTKSVFKNVGNFNSGLKSGGDKEWGQRVYQHGYRLVYSADTCIAHPARASLSEIARKITRTRAGGYDLESLTTSNKLKLNWQRLTTLLWRLKPPSKSVFTKLNSCMDSVSLSQKIQLIGIAIGLHYYGVWGDLKSYLKINS